MTRPFALGISPERSEHCEAMSLEGCEGAEGLDPAVKYRSCLQNWVIDTGSEVILVDTGLPSEYPDMAADPDAGIYIGAKLKTYLEALADLGYKPEQVSKILITHKHADHTGELRAFPNAQIICSAAEAEADEIKPYNPTVATFADGAYYEFPASHRIAPGVTYIYAPGHTKGNCIVAVETDGLFYLIHGDVTYTDVALYENRLSVVFEDLAAARETLNRVRAFCRARPTVYLGTHTPETLESHAQRSALSILTIRQPSFRRAKSSSRRRLANASAPSVAMYTIPQSMMALRSRISRPTGVARAANSRRRSSTGRRRINLKTNVLLVDGSSHAAVRPRHFIRQGNTYSGWPCHGKEHALSAYYDITHGEGLAIITPHWMRHVLEKAPDAVEPRLIKYGVNVFGIDAALPPQEIAEKAIQATHDMVLFPISATTCRLRARERRATRRSRSRQRSICSLRHPI